MIKLILNESETKATIEMCNNILSDSVTPEYIVQSLELLSQILYMIMPRDYVYYDLATEHIILNDDIVEMISISEEEKEEAINELILIGMDKFIKVAQDILDKIEADKSRYCTKLMQLDRDF